MCTLADDGVPSDGVGHLVMVVALSRAKRVGAAFQWNFSQTQKVFRFCGGFIIDVGRRQQVHL